jgi:hypothetical protein
MIQVRKVHLPCIGPVAATGLGMNRLGQTQRRMQLSRPASRRSRGPTRSRLAHDTKQGRQLVRVVAMVVTDQLPKIDRVSGHALGL